MFQLGTIEPRVTGVASNGYLRRKTGQKRFCKFTSLEQATRSCSIVMAWVDCNFPRESLAAQGFSQEQIEDIMKNFVQYDPEKDPVDDRRRRRYHGGQVPKWVIKNPKTVYRVVGLQVTVCLVPYLRYKMDECHMGYDDEFSSGVDVPEGVKTKGEGKVEEPDTFDNFAGRHITMMGHMPYYNNPWPADTRWSILMPTRDFYPHVSWELERLLENGSMTQRNEKMLERHSMNKQSYFDSSAYIYYP
jgi:hypothetical protein